MAKFDKSNGQSAGIQELARSDDEHSHPAKRFLKKLGSAERTRISMTMRFAQLILAGSLLASLPCLSQVSSEFYVSKGLIYTQTGAAAPLPLASGGAHFQASAPGFGGPPLATSAKVVVPGGATQQLAYSQSDDLFEFVDQADNIAALDAKHPAGNYAFTLSSTILGNLSGTVALPATALPAPASVANWAAVQSVDALFDFTLTFAPGGSASDSFDIEIIYQGNSIFSDNLTADATQEVIPAQTLPVGDTVEVRARVSLVNQSFTGAPFPTYEFFSETRFNLVTKGGGGGPTNNVPPQLATSFPTNGETGVNPYLAVVFQFSEDMDSTKADIQWSPNVDLSRISYIWGDSKTLACVYSNGFPAAEITWALNPVAGAPNNFRSAAGLELPPYSGYFVTQGGTPTCPGSSSVEGAGFRLFKSINYLQTNASAPALDPAFGARLFAQYVGARDDFSTHAALEYPVPIPQGPHHLDFFGYESGTNVLNQILTNQFANQAALNLAYPSGSYAFELRNPPTVIAQRTDLALTGTAYPPAPQFSNVAAAQNVNPTNDLTLSWTPYATAGANDAISVEIDDDSGAAVFVAPQTCAGLKLPANSGSIVIPAGTLAVAKNYTAVLNFYHVTDQQSALGTVAMKGVAGLMTTTRMPLATGGALPPANPAVFISIQIVSPTVGTLIATVSPNRTYIIQTSGSLRGPWTSLSTNQSPVSTLTVPFNPTALGATTFFRAAAQ